MNFNISKAFANFSKRSVHKIYWIQSVFFNNLKYLFQFILKDLKRFYLYIYRTCKLSWMALLVSRWLLIFTVNSTAQAQIPRNADFPQRKRPKLIFQSGGTKGVPCGEAPYCKPDPFYDSLLMESSTHMGTHCLLPKCSASTETQQGDWDKHLESGVCVVFLSDQASSGFPE